MSITGSWLTNRCLSNSCRTFVRSWDTGRLSEYICWISGAWCVAQGQVPDTKIAVIYQNWPISAIAGKHELPYAARLANSSLANSQSMMKGPLLPGCIVFLQDRVRCARYVGLITIVLMCGKAFNVISSSFNSWVTNDGYTSVLLCVKYSSAGKPRRGAKNTRFLYVIGRRWCWGAGIFKLLYFVQPSTISDGSRIWKFPPASRRRSNTTLKRCLPFAQREIASRHQTASTTSKTRYWSSPTRWKTPKMLHMRARSDMRSYGLYFRSVISVCHFHRYRVSWLTISLSIGSRYIFDLYYDKEAISKPLYEWLLKNGYADGNLIAKWKKQGYEKVRTTGLAFIYSTDLERTTALLPTMYTDKRDEFQRNLHLSSTTSAAERRSNHWMCELWVSWLFFCWLTSLPHDTLMNAVVPWEYAQHGVGRTGA